jgi:hypothetical protein
VSIVVNGRDPGNEDAVLPVEISCTTCGRGAPVSDPGYAVYLTELTSWAQAHECPRGLRVT